MFNEAMKSRLAKSNGTAMVWKAESLKFDNQPPPMMNAVSCNSNINRVLRYPKCDVTILELWKHGENCFH